MGDDIASSMGKLIEVWLGNKATRKAIKTCVGDCKKCGKRIDLALRSYSGEKVVLCLKCRAAVSVIEKVLNKFVENGKMDKKTVLITVFRRNWGRTFKIFCREKF